MKLAIFILLCIGLLFATMSSDEISAARQLIDSNISCSQLSSSQLQLIGDYYMELMHPGAAHDAMEQMMGGEGSASLAQSHIQIAESLYCGQSNTTLTYGGMMGMMPVIYRSNFGGGMMSYPYGGMMGYGNGTMGYSYGWGWIFDVIFWGLMLVGLILLIYWLYRNLRNETPKSSLASEILQQRYAKGEITKEKYQDMKKDLGG